MPERHRKMSVRTELAIKAQLNDNHPGRGHTLCDSYEEDIKDLMESLILAQDERWRRA